MLIAGIVVAQNFLNTGPEVVVQTTYGPVAGAQLARMLGTAGFDARRDILGVSVNRWPIANAESGAAAFTNVASDQAKRAIQECLAAAGWFRENEFLEL
jgi:hypothetical protein